jgi:hypothetical protein
MLRQGVKRTAAWGTVSCVVSLAACSGTVAPAGLTRSSVDAGTSEQSSLVEPRDESNATAPSSSADVNTSVTSSDAGPGETSSGANPVDHDTESEPAMGPVVVRLTQVELNHVLRDVLGDTSEPARSFVAEDEYTPFDNDAQRQTVSSSLIDGIAVLADDVASRLAYDESVRSSWMPCEPDGDTDSVCFDTTVANIGERLLRRRLTQSEVERYRVLLDFASERQDFYAAVELLLSALIQDPEFLYRMERGLPDDPTTLGDYELATRMGFLLLGSTPDDELLVAARNGELRDPETRRAQAERLLQDSRARTQINRFHAMWLGYRAIPHDAMLNDAFQLETESLIERVVFDEPQNYLQLFQSAETYLNEALADHYGFDAPSGGEGWVTYPLDAGRAGILSHGSVLSAFAKFNDTSPTQRGIFIRTRLLCLGVPTAPPTVDVDQPPGGEASADACKFERYRLHREQSGCADCHNLFEPIGMGLEQFDRAGRYRVHDDDNEECEIPANGEVPGMGTFSGPKELAQLLVDNDAIQGCMVRHFLQYTLARTALSDREMRWVNSAYSDFVGDGLLLRDWIVNVVSGEEFARREVNP